MKLWLACASSPNKLRVCLCPTFLTNGWKNDSLQWIYYPTDHWVCFFVCFTDGLVNFRSRDWKIFGHAPHRDDYGLVQPVGPRLIQSWLFTVLYFSVQMALFPGSKWISTVWRVFWAVGVLNDQYFNKQATLASTQASRTCTAHNCLQLDWLHLNASQYTASKCV